MRSFLRTTVAVSLLVLTSGPARAAIPEKRESLNPVSLSETADALNQPMETRLAALRGQGTGGYKNLIKLMFDPQVAMERRWRAVTAAARIGGELSAPEMKRALESREWFMRNAALVAVARVDKKLALEAAHRLLSDKAMVVRAAAVDVISDLEDTSARDLLWKKLAAKENYRGKQSLWIRRRMVEALGKIETTEHIPKFVALLSDRDEALHAPTIQALEKLSGRKFGEDADPVKTKIAYWKRYKSQR